MRNWKSVSHSHLIHPKRCIGGHWVVVHFSPHKLMFCCWLFHFPLIKQHQCVLLIFYYLYFSHISPEETFGFSTIFFWKTISFHYLFSFLFFSYFHKITNIEHKKKYLLVYCPITQLRFMPLTTTQVLAIAMSFNWALRANDMKGFRQCFGSNFLHSFFTLQ